MKIINLTWGQINDPLFWRQFWFLLFLSVTPSSPSPTLEGHLKVTQRPSRDLNLAFYLASVTSEIPRNCQICLLISVGYKSKSRATDANHDYVFVKKSHFLPTLILDCKKVNRLELVTRRGSFQGWLSDELRVSGFRGDLRHCSNTQELPLQTPNWVQRDLRRPEETHQQKPEPSEGQVTDLPQG